MAGVFLSVSGMSVDRVSLDPSSRDSTGGVESESCTRRRKKDHQEERSDRSLAFLVAFCPTTAALRPRHLDFCTSRWNGSMSKEKRNDVREKEEEKGPGRDGALPPQLEAPSPSTPAPIPSTFASSLASLTARTPHGEIEGKASRLFLSFSSTVLVLPPGRLERLARRHAPRQSQRVLSAGSPEPSLPA